MANVTFSTDVTWSREGVLSYAKIGDKQIVIDEPKNLGGTDKGPNPVEYVLAALGGCINVLIVTFAKQFAVEVNDINVYVEGDLDPDGFLGKNKAVRPGFSEIRYTIELDSPSDQKNIDDLLAHVQNVCPVKDTLEGTKVVLQQRANTKQ